MQFDCGTIWSFGEPDVQILPLACFEEEYVVAVVKVRQLVELVELCFRIQFGILAAMWKKSIEIIEKMPLPSQ